MFSSIHLYYRCMSGNIWGICSLSIPNKTCCVFYCFGLETQGFPGRASEPRLRRASSGLCSTSCSCAGHQPGVRGGCFGGKKNKGQQQTVYSGVVVGGGTRGGRSHFFQHVNVCIWLYFFPACFHYGSAVCSVYLVCKAVVAWRC